MATVHVVVKVTAQNVHVFVGKREVPLANNGNTWTGSLPAVVCSDEKTLEILAPAFTDWSIVVQCDGTKVLEEDGTTDRNPFEITFTPTNSHL